jgi:hypothetical protein
MTDATQTPDSTCRSCGAPIAWVVTAARKRAPMDPDGTPHFATCPHAAAWRRKATRGPQETRGK